MTPRKIVNGSLAASEWFARGDWLKKKEGIKSFAGHPLIFRNETPYYAKKQGRPSIPPGVYFRMLLIGYFERIDSAGSAGVHRRARVSLAARLRRSRRRRNSQRARIRRNREAERGERAGLKMRSRMRMSGEGAVIAVTLHGGAKGDTKSLPDTLEKAQSNLKSSRTTRNVVNEYMKTRVAKKGAHAFGGIVGESSSLGRTCSSRSSFAKYTQAPPHARGWIQSRDSDAQSHRQGHAEGIIAELNARAALLRVSTIGAHPSGVSTWPFRRITSSLNLPTKLSPEQNLDGGVGHFPPRVHRRARVSLITPPPQ